MALFNGNAHELKSLRKHWKNVAVRPPRDVGLPVLARTETVRLLFLRQLQDYKVNSHVNVINFTQRQSPHRFLLLRRSRLWRDGCYEEIPG